MSDEAAGGPAAAPGTAVACGGGPAERAWAGAAPAPEPPAGRWQPVQDRRASFSPAVCLLIGLWIVVEAALLAGAFTLLGRPTGGGPVDAYAAALAVYLAAVPAALALALVWLLCGPRDRRGQRSAAAIAFFALGVWTVLDQMVTPQPRQDVLLFFQAAWQVRIAVTPVPLLLVWWLWGVAASVCFCRFFWRWRVVPEGQSDEVRLRLSGLLAATLLVSITAAGSRYWVAMLPIDREEFWIITACVFGFGICSGWCLLWLTVGMLRPAWWGYAGFFAALLVTALLAAALYRGGWTRRMMDEQWILALLASLGATLVHYAVFLLPVRAAGYRLRWGGR